MCIIKYGCKNRGIRSIEGKKTYVQCPFGRKLFNDKIALEMELVYDKNVVFYMKKRGGMIFMICHFCPDFNPKRTLK